MLPDHSEKIAVAPMMDWTDRHDRYFLRLISRRAVLYTEMVTTGAILFGDRHRFLRFDPTERPLVLQLGGSDPAALAESARIGAGYGYDAINLNVGCPSDRVQSGAFGACLMQSPDLVARCVAAMVEAVDVPVTVKHRLGVDDQDEEATLPAFVDRVAEAGCRHFVVHARKAWLSGLSPKQNREVPPLRHGLVHALKRARPDLAITINGGIGSLDAAADHLAQVDGVMLGRLAYQEPYVLADVDRRFYGDGCSPLSRVAVAEAMGDYIDRAARDGVPAKSVTRHMMGLFNGLPGARAWRRHLAEEARHPGATGAVVLSALRLVQDESEARESGDDAQPAFERTQRLVQRA
ncbi:MAG: tRNA dihydrouridine(20/20a) synthase DusA [Alphaproteobacteria bacterium]